MAVEIRKTDLKSLPKIDQDKFKLILSSAGLTALKGEIYKANPINTLLGINKLKAGFERNYDFSQGYNGQQDGKDFFGTPVFSNLVFKEGSYLNRDGGIVNYKQVTLDTVLMDISMQKMIVKTPVQGRNGTVKEYISNGDYSINIRGGIFNKDPDSYPTSQVNDLITICNVPNDLQITSWFLQMFSIFNIVIESFDFVQQEGFQSSQLFNLQCVSDEPIELKKSEI